jgi:hypothetical protein
MATLIALSTAVADLPPPPGIVEITPRLRFTGVEKYPQHVFYVSLSTSRGNPTSGTQLRFEVKNADPVTLKGSQRRVANVFLLAMDKNEFEKRKGEDASLTWLTEKATGVLSAPLEAPPTFGPKGKEVPPTEYSVTVDGGKLTAQPAAKTKRTSELSPDPATRPWVVGIAGTLSLALFGVWFARRRHSPK